MPKVLFWVCVGEYIDPEELIVLIRRVVRVVKKHPEAKTAILYDEEILVVYVGKATKAKLLKLVHAECVDD